MMQLSLWADAAVPPSATRPNVSAITAMSRLIARRLLVIWLIFPLSSRPEVHLFRF
jgi:hypothetical protein